MADVAPGNHGGDGAGDDPLRPNVPPSGTVRGSDKKRGPTKNTRFRKMFEDHGSRPFAIQFDFNDQETIRPVLSYSKDFKNLIGVHLRSNIPNTYGSWSKVPPHIRTTIWPHIEHFFDLSPYLSDPVNGPRLVSGVMSLCAKLYSSAKYHFKKKYFIDRGGVNNANNIRELLPPDMTSAEWNALVDFYCDEHNVRISAANARNRSRQQYTSHHGSKSYVETRYERHAKTGVFPSLIQGWSDHHTRNGTIPLNDVAQRQYTQMSDMLKAQVGAPKPMTESKIMDKVLGVRRGFKKGRGYIVPDGSRFVLPSSRPSSSSPSSSSPSSLRPSSSSPSQPHERMFTKSQVIALLGKTQKRVDKTLSKWAESLSAQGFNLEISSDEDLSVDFDVNDGEEDNDVSLGFEVDHND